MNTVPKLIFFLLTFSANNICESQTVRSPISSGYLGLGAYSNNHIDVFSIQSNQAALAKVNSATGIYSEKRFLLKELGFYDAALAIRTHSGNFGLDARYFGYADYNEMQLSLAYARSLGSRMDFGVQFNNYSIRVAGYGNASTINFDIGTLFRLTDKLNAGMHVYNPLRSKLGKNQEEKLASSYSTGIGYEASKKFFFSIEVVKEEDKPVNINAGLQYKFFPWVLTRAGIASATSSMFFGVGIGWKSIRLDATASFHQQLGITPGVMLLVPLSHTVGSEKEND